MAIEPHNHDTDGAPPRRVTVEDKPAGSKWWLWLLLLALLAALLFALSRCNRDETPAVVPDTNLTDVDTNLASTDTGTPPTAIEKVTLPGGEVIDLEPTSLGYQLQQYLASTEPTPRTFTFDKLNFATGSTAIRAEDQPTIAAISSILKAYPKAAVTLTGYADPRGDVAKNTQLSADRAKAVGAALTAAGIDAARITSKTGGETDPADPATKAQTLAEARRTDLTVTAK